MSLPSGGPADRSAAPPDPPASGRSLGPLQADDAAVAATALGVLLLLEALKPWLAARAVAG